MQLTIKYILLYLANCDLSKRMVIWSAKEIMVLGIINNLRNKEAFSEVQSFF